MANQIPRDEIHALGADQEDRRAHKKAKSAIRALRVNKKAASIASRVLRSQDRRDRASKSRDDGDERRSTPTGATIPATVDVSRTAVPVPTFSDEERASAARIRMIVDRKNGRKTAQWIVDLAKSH